MTMSLAVTMGVHVLMMAPLARLFVYVDNPANSVQETVREPMNS